MELFKIVRSCIPVFCQPIVKNGHVPAWCCLARLTILGCYSLATLKLATKKFTKLNSPWIFPLASLIVSCVAFYLEIRKIKQKQDQYAFNQYEAEETPSGSTLFDIARDSTIVTELIRQGIPLDKRDCSNHTLLRANPTPEVAKLLIDAQKEISTEDRFVCLQRLIRNKNHATLEFLLKERHFKLKDFSPEDQLKLWSQVTDEKTARLLYAQGSQSFYVPEGLYAPHFCGQSIFQVLMAFGEKENREALLLLPRGSNAFYFEMDFELEPCGNLNQFGSILQAIEEYIEKPFYISSDTFLTLARNPWAVKRLIDEKISLDKCSTNKKTLLGSNPSPAVAKLLIEEMLVYEEISAEERFDCMQSLLQHKNHATIELLLREGHFKAKDFLPIEQLGLWGEVSDVKLGGLLRDYGFMDVHDTTCIDFFGQSIFQILWAFVGKKETLEILEALFGQSKVTDVEREHHTLYNLTIILKELKEYCTTGTSPYSYVIVESPGAVRMLIDSNIQQKKPNALSDLLRFNPSLEVAKLLVENAVEVSAEERFACMERLIVRNNQVTLEFVLQNEHFKLENFSPMEQLKLWGVVSSEEVRCCLRDAGWDIYSRCEVFYGQSILEVLKAFGEKENLKILLFAHREREKTVFEAVKEGSLYDFEALIENLNQYREQDSPSSGVLFAILRSAWAINRLIDNQISLNKRTKSDDTLLCFFGLILGRSSNYSWVKKWLKEGKIKVGDFSQLSQASLWMYIADVKMGRLLQKYGFIGINERIPLIPNRTIFEFILHFRNPSDAVIKNLIHNFQADVSRIPLALQQGEIRDIIREEKSFQPPLEESEKSDSDFSDIDM